MKRVVAILPLVLAAGCSLVFQDSVRGRSVYCSTSRFWYGSDLVIGGSMLYVAADRVPDSNNAKYLPAGLFLGSAALGIYKRHNCVQWREKAPPEEWQRMAAVVAAERQAAAEAAAQREVARQEALRVALEQAAQQQLEQQQQPQQQPAPEPEPDSLPPASQWQPAPAPQPNINVSIERHSSRDDIGKSCDPRAGWSGDGDPDKAWPHAGTCQYGAVCYHHRCTVWCSSDKSCPNNMRCAFTSGLNLATELCQ